VELDVLEVVVSIVGDAVLLVVERVVLVEKRVDVEVDVEK
jgi:hypothetical protein